MYKNANKASDLNNVAEGFERKSDHEFKQYLFIVLLFSECCVVLFTDYKYFLHLMRINDF